MREGETSLLKGADALIADVEAALADFVTQQDRTKKARVELVLDQCKARRGALRASLASERAALVSSDDGGSDLVRAAQQLVQEAERASEGADEEKDALRTARDALQEASQKASSSAHKVRTALAAVSQRAESDAPARPPARPVSVSSGDVKTACLGRGDGWMNTPSEYAEFDVGDAHVSSVKIAPGTVSAQIDGADAKLTIQRLSSALDWKTLRLIPEKALKLLQRPPVRFVADALQAIATKAGWEFNEFFLRMAPVTIPVLICGLITCFFIERFNLATYGENLPESLRLKIIEDADAKALKRTNLQTLHLKIEAILGLCLIAALGLHLAPVGVIGLFLLVGLTSMKGIISEHYLGASNKEFSSSNELRFGSKGSLSLTI